jgi:hypothetical protein
MNIDALKSDLLSRIRTYDPPPKGFDPRTATDEVLRRYGLPRRPHPEREPELARMWKLAFSRPITFVKAELAVDSVMSNRDARRQRPARPQFGQSGWAGVVRELYGKSDYATPATMVFSQWAVPDVIAIDPAGYTPLTVGFWVGLDGFQGEANGLLQAGVAATVKPGFFDSSVEYWAWVEWYTAIEAGNYAARMVNLPVAKGDAIFVLVCAPEPAFGLISMLNLSKGVATTVGISAPPKVTWLGGTAEWAVEGVSQYLPYFSPVTFTGCTGGSLHELFYLDPGGLVQNIVTVNANPAVDGQPITNTYIASPTTFVVEWLGFGGSVLDPADARISLSS